MMSTERWLAGLAGRGLAGAAPVAAPPGPMHEVISAAASHRLLGALAAAAADGELGLDPEDVARISQTHETAMREVLLLEEVLLEAVGVLTAAGVDHRVLKGAALAHMVYDDPAQRCFGDNDVLVAPAQIDAAVDALIDAGARRRAAPISSDFDRRFAKSVTLSWSGLSGAGSTELDLHRTLAAGPYGFLIPLEELTRDPVEVLLADRSVLTLPIDLHLLHGAIHVALGDTQARLGNVRDLALLAGRSPRDPTAVIETAQRWGCAAPVAMGLRATTSLGHDPTPIEEWARSFVSGADDVRALAAYRVREGRFRRQALASWRVLGWRDRIAFSRALLVPGAANRAGRAGRSRPVPRRRSG